MPVFVMELHCAGKKIKGAFKQWDDYQVLLCALLYLKNRDPMFIFPHTAVLKMFRFRSCLTSY